MDEGAAPIIYRQRTVVFELDGSGSPPAARRVLFELLSLDGWPWLLSMSAAADLGAFSWAIRAHFVGDRTPGPMQIITALSLIAAAVFFFAIWRTTTPDWRRAAGFCLHLAAIALFGWAVLATRQSRPALAFAGERPARLFRSGPYSYIRHPFYTSYLVFWLGCVVATSSLLMPIAFLALAAIYIVAARGEERDILRSPLRLEYEAYRIKAGLFWPKLRQPRRQPRPVSTD